MAITRISITDFLVHAKAQLVLDVRSPAEYQHAHIPGAVNLPLFDNEQRKVVGTLYKQHSKEAAIKQGLDYFGVKMKTMVETVEALLAQHTSTSKTVYVHCWRGGMRSGGVAWLLDLYGFKVFVLQGGYKAYRNQVIQCFEHNYQFKVLGGQTGSGKTALLKSMQAQGRAVIDFEALACHRGSSFGALGQTNPPSQEQFENNLALQLSMHAQQIIWVEDESQRIGQVNIPKPLWLQLRASDWYYLDLPFAVRLQRIIVEYGSFNKAELIAATERIRKRSGGLDCQTAVAAIQNDDLETAFTILLNYYDKQYQLGSSKREGTKPQVMSFTYFDETAIIKTLVHE